MKSKDLETLKGNVNRLVKIQTCDGESLLARVVLVSEEDEDLIYELVSTSRESQYEKFDEQPAYRIGFEEIQAVEAAQSRPGNRHRSSAGPDEVGG